MHKKKLTEVKINNWLRDLVSNTFSMELYRHLIDSHLTNRNNQIKYFGLDQIYKCIFCENRFSSLNSAFQIFFALLVNILIFG